MKTTITQERLKHLVDYNPDTGIFTRKKDGKGFKKGDAAGCESMGYLVFMVDGFLYKAHRLAFLWMEGYFPENDIDHIDRNKKNNRWVNLREVSRVCNTRNCGLSARNKSGITGVAWYKENKRWVVRIKVGKKNLHVGYFVSILDAAMARWRAERKHGFNRCNSQSTAFLFLRSQGLV